MSFVVVENLNSARKKTEVTSKPCSLVSLSSAWLMLPNSPSPPVDQLLLLSLPLKLLPASHISPPMPTPYKKPKTCLLTFQKISLKKAPDRTFLGKDRRQHGSYYHSLAHLSSSLVKGWWLFWRNSGGGGRPFTTLMQWDLLQNFANGLFWQWKMRSIKAHDQKYAWCICIH